MMASKQLTLLRSFKMCTQRKYNRKHYLKNRDALLKQVAKYQEGNREYVSERKKKHYIRNRESILKRMKGYREDNQEAIKKRKKAYASSENGKATHKIRMKKYNQTEKGRHAKGTHLAKRKGLKYIPLNKPFNDSAGHHLDERHVLYIPKELHQSVYHNIWTGEGMDDINKKALRWYTEGVTSLSTYL